MIEFEDLLNQECIDQVFINKDCKEVKIIFRKAVNRKIVFNNCFKGIEKWRIYIGNKSKECLSIQFIDSPFLKKLPAFPDINLIKLEIINCVNLNSLKSLTFSEINITGDTGINKLSWQVQRIRLNISNSNTTKALFKGAFGFQKRLDGLDQKCISYFLENIPSNIEYIPGIKPILILDSEENLSPDILQVLDHIISNGVILIREGKRTLIPITDIYEKHDKETIKSRHQQALNTESQLYRL